MGKLISIIFFVAVGMGMMYAMMSNHFVKCEEGWFWVPKESYSLSETYVDISTWTTEDLAKHPEVTQAMIDNGHKDKIAHLMEKDAKGVLDGLLEKGKTKLGEILDIN